MSVKLSEWKTVQEGLSKKTFRQVGPIRLVESAGRMTYQATGVFQNYIQENLNGRVYGKALWERNLAEGSEFSKMLAERGVLGMIEHPEDGITRLNEVSHVVTKVWIASESEIAESNGALVEGDILGTLEVLNTPHGNALRGLIEAQVRWGVSSRGSGTTTCLEGVHHVNDDFILETWDVVFTPSVARAIPRIINEIAEGRNPNIKSEITEAEAPKQKILVMVESEKYGKLQLVENKDGKLHFDGNQSLNLGDFDTVSEALAKFTQLAGGTKPSKPKPQEESVNEPPVNPTSNTAMSKLHEARSLKSAVVNLGLQIESNKKLKASDKAALFESIDSFRVQAASLVEADASVKFIIEDVNTRLNAISTRLDEEEEAPPSNAAPSNAAPSNAAPSNPNPDEEGDEDGKEAAATMIKAADLLRSAAEGGVDPEAALATADELEACADGCEDGNVEFSEDEPFADIEEPETLPEAKRAITRLQRRLQINENRTARLNAAAETLIEDHKKLKSNRQSGGEGGGLFEQAAKKLATRYNTDMCNLGRQLFKLAKPELYEANKKELEAITNYSKLEEASERIVKAAATAAPKPNPGLNEDKDKDKNKDKNKDKDAELHESVGLISSLRRKK